jgi:flagellar export protein FliJ
MKRFKFSLETVHNLREMRRDEAERQLEQSAAQVSAARAVVEQIEQHRDAVETELARATGPLCTHELALQVSYLEFLNQREQETQQHLAVLEGQHEAQCETTLTAARAAEVTEQLRARQQARHATAVARVEQLLLDEIAIAATLRKRLGGDD